MDKKSKTSSPRRYPVLDIWVDDVDMDSTLAQLVDFVEQGDGVKTILASNPEKQFSVPPDAFLYDFFRKADLLIPDGVGMILALRILYGVQCKRVPGCDLMQHICALAADKGYKIFIYGAQEEANAKAVEVLRNRLPSIQIVGRSNGFVPPEKMDELVDRINASEAQILFLALGSPRQEKWIATQHEKLKHVRVCQGIGGTLDVIAGIEKRAPEAFQKVGAEWLYRLMRNPTRIKRMRRLPVFLILVFWEKLKSLAKPAKEEVPKS
jgi:N-acetylglucosaminyldiphosphoundecaprenol N-acetyl-beta-D-mannosaminyltransferase